MSILKDLSTQAIEKQSVVPTQLEVNSKMHVITVMLQKLSLKKFKCISSYFPSLKKVFKHPFIILERDFKYIMRHLFISFTNEF